MVVFLEIGRAHELGKMIRTKTGYCPLETETELVLLNENVSDNKPYTRN